MADCHDGLGHRLSKAIHHVQEIARMVKPICLNMAVLFEVGFWLSMASELTIISLNVLVQDTTGSLIGDISDPDCPN